MLVSVFDQYGALNSAPVFSALRQGLDRVGIRHDSMNLSADVAVIWSQVWAGRMRSNQQVWQHFRSLGRPVIVVEVGMIQRGHTWKLGINGTGITAYYGTDYSGKRLEKLGLHLTPWRTQGDRIVIACQRTDSEQWTGQPDIKPWLQQTVDTIRQHTDRPIVIRPHPRQRVEYIAQATVELPKKISGTYDDFDFFESIKNAWAVVNHNSGPGCQSVICGIPAFVHHSSLVAPVGNLDFGAIENPKMPARESWAEMLAHTEWTTEEIAQGEPLARLLLPVPGQTFVNPG